MSIVYWFYIFFIILDTRVALISHSLSKVTSKAAKNNGLIGLISPHSTPLLAVPQPEWGMGKPDDGYHCKQQLLMVVELTGCSPYGAQPIRDSVTLYEHLSLVGCKPRISPVTYPEIVCSLWRRTHQWLRNRRLDDQPRSAKSSQFGSCNSLCMLRLIHVTWLSQQCEDEITDGLGPAGYWEISMLKSISIKFSNLPSDWMAAQPPTNQKPC